MVRKIRGGLFSGVPFAIEPAAYNDDGKRDPGEGATIELEFPPACVVTDLLLLLLIEEPQAATAIVKDASMAKIAN